jgi:two-component system, chemotaxis family, CheB/CheR fusion protein
MPASVTARIYTIQGHVHPMEPQQSIILTQGPGPLLQDATAPLVSQSLAQDTTSPAPFPVVGLGASSGGLKALMELLAELPADIGMGFVVIQHLDPHHDSQLANLLTTNCRLPVDDAIDGTAVLANHVYVITSNSRLTLDHGLLRVAPRGNGPGAHHPIDVFFQSLARDRPNSAIGVILSGTGSDGTLGLASIKAARGVTFAQDGTADYPGMPESAVNHGSVDFILRPTDMAKELAKISQFGFPTIPPPVAKADDDDLSALAPSPSVADDPEGYAAIVTLLHKATGVDYTHYRSSTILRRTQRRMAMVTMDTLADYARFLVDNPVEIDALARDILIHVTSFFRDQAAFDSLRTTAFPALMESREPDTSIRIWVVGCSTGQEVYSIAMQLVEYCRSVVVIPRIQIFATDISDWALNKARLGIYPESIAKEVPEDLLGRYFTKEAGGYHVIKMIRELCVFAKHDVTSDTPFSRIDLISCRNVLIYLGSALQKYVLPTFHSSLRPEGFLLLGTSETLGQASNLFATIDEANRLYRSLASAVRVRPSAPRHRVAKPSVSTAAIPPVPSGSDMQQAADQIVLGRFAPPGVLVNTALEVIHFRGKTHPFLAPAPGEPNRNLLTMVPFGVSRALRDAVAEAKRLNVPVRRERIAHRREDTSREIAFEVIPIALPNEDSGYLILFEEQKNTRTLSQKEGPANPGAAAPDPAGTLQLEVIQLRNELAAATDYNHSILTINSTLSDKMREVLEDAQSSTEEYRSTNEELQTAKEEVESANEELITINEELRFTSGEREKIAEALSASAELMTAIVETMRYPLLVLTDKLRVDNANMAFLDTFAVNRTETIGRLVYDLGDGQWNIPELRRLLEDILPSNSAFDDFEVSHDFPHKGRMTMLLNARRLQGSSDRSRRIVLVIADITERSRMAQVLQRVSAEQLRSNAELEQFAAVTAHDLQEPLRMVSSYVGLLEQQYGSIFDERARKFMAFATNGAKRMSEMINGILAYSLLGHETTGKVGVDCARAVTDAIANLAMKISDAHAAITVADLPRVTASREQLIQLFQNIIGNAVKYHSPERSPTVNVSAHDDGPEWSFAISDNGIGMREDEYLKIFLPFHRGDPDRYVKGCGIGLATCKRIVDHHKGRIWVTSKINVGSTFTFTIPK